MVWDTYHYKYVSDTVSRSSYGQSHRSVITHTRNVLLVMLLYRKFSLCAVEHTSSGGGIVAFYAAHSMFIPKFSQSKQSYDFCKQRIFRVWHKTQYCFVIIINNKWWIICLTNKFSREACCWVLRLANPTLNWIYLTLKVLNFWKFTAGSYCSLKPLWLGMGEVVPARTSPTLHPLPLCISCRD